MKLHEIAMTPANQDKFNLGGGFILVRDPSQFKGVTTFGIRELMVDGEVGEASYVSFKPGEDAFFRTAIFSIKLDGETKSRNFTGEDDIEENFIQWCKQMIPAMRKD